MEVLASPLFILAVLCFNIVISEWLVRRTFLRHLGTALLVILVTAILANLRVIPSASNAPPLYDIIFSYIAPIAIFYLLLEVNLRNLKQAGLPMLLMFAIGAIGTMAGVYTGMWAVSGRESIGPSYNAIGGMFTGTYIGGSINFNAVALHYEVNKEGTLYAGSVAVDNIITTSWMVVTIVLPKVLSRFYYREPKTSQLAASEESKPAVSEEMMNKHNHDAETLSPLDLGIMIGLGLAALLVSNLLSSLFSGVGVTVPSILILTTMALVLAQIPLFHRLKGGRVLGMFTVYLFLAVIGAYCEFAALAEIGSLGVTLLIFATILVLVHGAITFGLGAALKQDWNIVAIASQANIGGSTSALALARSLDRPDLLLPAILVGALGNAVGTYLGFLVARSL
ncbi:MAG: DUF819 family protein [Blastocatellia bacterium]|nr:DUF819 family protein [Blastocatellia bacterium]